MRHTKLNKILTTPNKIPRSIPDTTSYKVPMKKNISDKTTKPYLTRETQLIQDEPINITSLEDIGTTKR